MDEQERNQKIKELAAEQWGEFCDELEFDDEIELSEGIQNGCFIKAWVWVNFAGTELSKEK